MTYQSIVHNRYFYNSLLPTRCTEAIKIIKIDGNEAGLPSDYKCVTDFEKKKADWFKYYLNIKLN